MSGSAFFKKDAHADLVAGGMAKAVDTAPLENNTVLLIDDGDPGGLLVAAWKPDEDIDTDRLNAWLADNGVRALGMAIRLLWTNEPEPAPTRDAWFLTCVAGEGAPPRFGVRNIDSDRWWGINPDDAPFLALSTASSLRELMATGDALVFKHMPARQAGETGRPLLLNTVKDAEWPKEQADGRL